METMQVAGAAPAELTWKEIIDARRKPLDLGLKEIWHYRDLLLILVRRDLLAVYTQTLLGPLWFMLQPIIATVAYIVIFSRAAKLTTSDLPPVLFYLSGLVLWGYFSECIIRTSGVFKENVQLMSKVYFPRLIIPLALIITNLAKLVIQFGLLLLVLFYYILFEQETRISINSSMVLVPFYILFVGLLGLGAGLVVTSVTTKYKDLSHLINFAVQLLMFASPVIFPLSSIKDQFFRTIIMLNPVSGFIEAFRYALTGQGSLLYGVLIYDIIFTFVLLFFGLILFQRIQRGFVDVI